MLSEIKVARLCAVVREPVRSGWGRRPG